MSDYLIDQLLADDLLKFTLERKDISPIPRRFTSFREQIGPSPFSEEMGLAVNEIMERYSDNLGTIYDELLDMKVHDKGTFGQYALSSAVYHFEKGFSSSSFLGFCALILGVACCYFDCECNNPHVDIYQCAADVIALVLTSFRITGEFYKCGFYEDLVNTSLNFVYRFDSD